MKRDRTTLIGMVIAVFAASLLLSAAAAEVPPVSEAAFQKMKDTITAQASRGGGNWYYAEMEDWQKNMPPEKRVGQARWDVPAGASYFNFGPTGIRVAMDVATPREAVVMYVFEDSPADKKIFRGDRIIGVNGQKFKSDELFPKGGFGLGGPRLEVAKAIEETEGNPSLQGILTFTVKRGLTTIKVPIKLEQIGYFSPTFPYNCKKSRKLAEAAGDWLIEHRRGGKHMAWGPPRMGDWIDMPARLALLSFGDRYKKYISCGGSGGAMWSWISGVRLITAAEKQQFFKDKALLDKLKEMSEGYAAKSGPSGAYSHKTWYEGAPFQLAFAAGLNCLGQAIAYKCGADIAEESYLRTRYLLTCKTGDIGNIGYGAANKTPLSVEDARKHLGSINPSLVPEETRHRSVGGSACITLAHFVDPRDSFSEAFARRGARYAMAARWSSRQAHACGSLTFVYNHLAASIAPLVGEEKMYRKYMDDMKWWLNIARCHNGGWYFEPKVDKESNKNDRIHMTAAAILMLNAPLRELYSNGKGMSDPLAARAATTTAGTATPKPRPARVVPKLREARNLSEKSRQTLSNSLLKTLVKLSDADLLKKVPVKLSRTRSLVWVKQAAADGSLVLQQLVGEAQMDGTVKYVTMGSKTATVNWNDLSASDRASLAMLVANLKPESRDAQALVAVYLEGFGRVREADLYFKKAGPESTNKLSKLFD